MHPLFQSPIFTSKYTLLSDSPFHEGSQGYFYKCKSKYNPNQNIILKLMEATNMTKFQQINYEISILLDKGNQHLVQIIDKPMILTYQKEDALIYSIGILMEEINSTFNLYLQQQPNNKLSTKELLLMMKSLISGLQFAHENKMVHCDFNSDNILVNCNQNFQNPHFKIAGFGTSIRVDTETTQPATYYSAPELFSLGPQNKIHFSEKSDIYDFALFFLQCLGATFRRKTIYHDEVTSVLQTLEQDELTTRLVKELIPQLLNFDPSERMTASEMLVFIEDKFFLEIAELSNDQNELALLVQKCSQEIGVPKENYSVALCPKDVRRLLQLGIRAKVQSGAGEFAFFSDQEYIKYGAKIVSAQEIWEQTDIIIKWNALEFNQELGYHEADSLQKTSLLITFLQQNIHKTIIEKLLENKPKLTVLAWNCLPRKLARTSERAAKIDITASLTKLSGYKAAILGFQYLPKCGRSFQTTAGNFEPAKVFVIGCGIAGLEAIQTAKNFGAEVKAFDSRKEMKEQVEKLGAGFISLDGSAAEGLSYQTEQKNKIRKACQQSDIVITTLLIPGKPAPKLLFKDDVKLMKPGSVIIDMAAEAGGNVELTCKGQVYVYKEAKVTIVGLCDLEKSVITQAVEVFSLHICQFFNQTVQQFSLGNGVHQIQLDLNNEIVDSLTVISKGKFIDQNSSQKF